MKRLSDEQINTIVELLKEGKPLPEGYRWLLFEGKQETELIYAGKTREVDVLTETMAVPLQKVKVFGNVTDNEWHNMLIFGDNLQILKTLLKMKEEGKLKNPDGSRGVKLIYIDPPFGTGDIYGRNNVGAYSAKLMGAKYLEWLRQRIILLKELLSDDSGFYVRTDYHFGHSMKVLLDEVFGKENFGNEIVINRFKRQLRGLKQYNIATDSVLFYRVSESVAFNEIFRSRICSFCGAKKEPEWHHMVSSGLRKPPERIILSRLMLPPKGQHWKYTQQKIDQMTSDGKIRINEEITYTDIAGNRVKGIPEFLQTEDIPVDNNWTDLKGYQLTARYPTENPEELLERIIKASSTKGDIILDAFAGSGTTGAVAEKLGRKWIMVDSSKFSIYTIIKRMLNLKQKIGNKGKLLKTKPFTVYTAGLYDMKILKELPFAEYRKFALELFQCKDEPHTLAGIDLDGYFGQNNVLIFKWKKNNNKNEYVMDRGFIDNLHSIFGKRISKRFFIIAPAASVLFLEDYIERDGIKYYVLRIPYSIIDELHKKNFKLLQQPLSADISEVNKVMEQVGFDFIYPPNVECDYYIEKKKKELPFKEAVIKIKHLRSNILSKKPIPEEELGFKALSLVMIDYDFKGEHFDMDEKWFASDLEKSNYEVRFTAEKIKDKVMIIYMDVYGNEKKEVKMLKDFK